MKCYGLIEHASNIILSSIRQSFPISASWITRGWDQTRCQCIELKQRFVQVHIPQACNIIYRRIWKYTCTFDNLPRTVFRILVLGINSVSVSFNSKIGVEVNLHIKDVNAHLLQLFCYQLKRGSYYYCNTAVTNECVFPSLILSSTSISWKINLSKIQLLVAKLSTSHNTLYWNAATIFYQNLTGLPYIKQLFGIYFEKTN